MNQMLEYSQISQNFRLLTNSTSRYAVTFSLHMSAAGSYFEEEGECGVSHLLEHCKVTRTKKYDVDEFKQYLFTKDIYINAFTSRLGMEFMVSGHRDDFEEMLALIIEIALDPYFTQEVLEQEQEVVAREINQFTGQPNYRLNRTLIKHMYTDDSYYQNEVLGSAEDVKSATLETLETLQKKIFARSQFLLAISGGGIDRRLVEKKYKALSKVFRSEQYLPIDFRPANTLSDFSYAPVVSELAHDHAVVKIILPCRISLRNRPVRTYIRELMFEPPIGYLYVSLRDQKRLIYSLDYSFDKSTSTLNIEVKCSIEDVSKVVAEVKESFAQFDTIFTPDKLVRIREHIVKRQEIQQDEPNLAVEFMVNLLYEFGVIMQYEDYVRKLEHVTLQDISKEYHYINGHIDEMKVVVVSNKEAITQLDLL